MTDPIDFHPLPGTGPDDGTNWSLLDLVGQIRDMLAELPDGFDGLDERQNETKARLTAASAVLSGHAVLFGWDIAYRDDLGACGWVGDTVKVGDLTKGDRPGGHVIGNHTNTPEAVA